MVQLRRAILACLNVVLEHPRAKKDLPVSRTRAASNGTFQSPYMKAGTYTMTLYKGELAVASQTVTVDQNTLITSNIASTEVVSS